VPTHVALLRGVNVGGVKLAMADLREVVAGLGHAGVATYIQSGNVLFSTERTDTGELAAELEAAIADALTVRPKVIVLSRDELARVVRDNPYPQEPNPKALHAVFLPGEPAPQTAAAVAAAQQAAAERGGRDSARFVGRVLYLHTPDGYGRSELAVRLARGSGPLSPRQTGTARNWATVGKLLALCSTPA
jgi:uncharacterized protein (DUF1697 family)